MSIEDRNLKDGMKLVAKYKGEVWKAEVAETEDGLRIKLADGRLFKSVSSAGSAVMGGNACNGWKFWSLADGAEAAAPKPKKRGKAKPVTFDRLPDEEGQPEGQARFFCNACMDSFTAPANIEPIGCPAGHEAGSES